MTSDGSAYARFRRALNTGNEHLVLTVAWELPQIALDDALRICLVLRDGEKSQQEACYDSPIHLKACYDSPSHLKPTHRTSS